MTASTAVSQRARDPQVVREARAYTFRDINVLHTLADLAVQVSRAAASIDGAPAHVSSAAAANALASAQLGAAGYRLSLTEVATGATLEACRSVRRS